MALSIEERKIIQDYLPYGSRTEVAKQLGIRKQHINAYFIGETNSPKIERALLKKVKELKKVEEDSRIMFNGLFCRK
ncbi:MAG: hypothetical protein IJ338_08525 [Bacteroidaceae bacterium]|nr:hypothetical protein [Bacteroidaceae bacterium]